MKKFIALTLLMGFSSVFAKDCTPVVKKAFVGVVTAAGSVFGASPNCIAVSEKNLKDLKIKKEKEGEYSTVYSVYASLPVSCGTTWEVSVYNESCFVEKVEATSVE